MPASANVEFPPKADLRNVSKPLPSIPLGTIDPNLMNATATAASAKMVVDAFNAAISSGKVEKLADCFYAQAYWRDIVALTSHLRTLDDSQAIATALAELIDLRGLAGGFEMTGEPHFAVMSPFMVRSLPNVCPWDVEQLMYSISDVY